MEWWKGRETRDPRPDSILLVEDDPDDYVLIRDMIENLGPGRYELTWVSTHEDGLEEILSGRYDACLLDYRLGARDGLEILKKVSWEDLRMPIILMTGYGDYRVDVEAMRLGAADYLAKEDLNAQILERAIRYAVDKAAAWDALRTAYREMEKRVEERTAELVETNRALRHSYEKTKYFAYAVCHDLKSPSVAVYGLAKRLRERYRDSLGAKGVDHCDRILRATEQIAALVETINAYINTREQGIQATHIRLRTVLEGLREEFQTKLESRGIRWQVPVEDPLIQADRLALARALRNLVDNALKHGGEELRRIDLEYRENGDRHVLTVRDDGAGLLEDDTSRLFMPFFRVQGSASREGAGLGLAIVKEVAELHGGEAWVENGTGGGVVVTLSLPKAIKPRSGETASA